MKAVATFVALAAVPAALGATIEVSVGKDQLQFTPSSVTAQNGDVINFTFYPKNHTVVQSTLAAPCSPLAGGFATTFNNTLDAAPADLTTAPHAQFTVTDASKPLWFYCSQTQPVVHCAQGMVFAINPGPDGAANSFAKFQEAAKGAAAGGNSTTGGSNSTTPGSPNNTTTPGGTGGNGGNGTSPKPGSALLGAEAPLKAILAGALAVIGGVASLF